jgi:radical SAM superfamily enzyme YgiQ (UPF0313 family)
MYRDKAFAVRELDKTLEDIETARAAFGPRVTKVFVADGDALMMDMAHWEAILAACAEAFPNAKRVSSYATAMNVNEKSLEELVRLQELGLSLLYVGPETGDDLTFKRIAKGSDYAGHVDAARKAHDAGMKISSIFLLGAGGTERSEEHAHASARLITEMDPEYVSALTVTVLEGTPLHKMQTLGKFTLPSVEAMLGELRIMVAEAEPTDAVFRTNHASNYLPLAGRLPKDRSRIVETLDRALAGDVTLRPEWARGL